MSPRKNGRIVMKRTYSKRSKPHNVIDLQGPRAEFMTSLNSPTLSVYYTPVLSYSPSPTPLTSPWPSPTQFSRGSIPLFEEHRLSVPSLDVDLGGLGKRRGFKGSPLSTSSLSLKSSLLFLPPSLSLLTVRSLIDWPPSPRSPLEAVTNMIKNRKSLVRDISQDLQDFYDDADPFCTFGDSFFPPSVSFDVVPTGNIDNLSAYHQDQKQQQPPPPPPLSNRPLKQSLKLKTSFGNFKSVSTCPSKRKPFAMRTTIYDISVADVPAKPLRAAKRKSKPLPPPPRKHRSPPSRSSPNIVLTLPSVSSLTRRGTNPVLPNDSVPPAAQATSDTLDFQESTAPEPEQATEEMPRQAQDIDLSPDLLAVASVSLCDPHDLDAYLRRPKDAAKHTRGKSVPCDVGHVNVTSAEYPNSGPDNLATDVGIDEPQDETRAREGLDSAVPSPSSDLFEFVLPELCFSSGAAAGEIVAHNHKTPSPKRKPKVADLRRASLASSSAEETQALLELRATGEGDDDPDTKVSGPPLAENDDDPFVIADPQAITSASPSKRCTFKLPHSPKRKRAIHNLRAASLSWTLPEKQLSGTDKAYGRHRRSVAVDDKTGKIISMALVMAGGRGARRAGGDGDPPPVPSGDGGSEKRRSSTLRPLLLPAWLATRNSIVEQGGGPADDDGNDEDDLRHVDPCAIEAHTIGVPSINEPLPELETKDRRSKALDDIISMLDACVADPAADDDVLVGGDPKENGLLAENDPARLSMGGDGDGTLLVEDIGWNFAAVYAM